MAPSIDTRIEELEDRIQLYNVPVPYDGGELHDIDWSKEMLNWVEADALTQDAHIQRTLSTEFKLASGLVYGATMLTLHDAMMKTVVDEEGLYHKDPLYHKTVLYRLIELFKNDFIFKNPVLTSTRIIYTPQGPDLVVHNYGYPDVQQREVNLVGPFQYLKRVDKDVQEVLFGTRDTEKFAATVKYLTGKMPFLWYYPEDPLQNEECVLALGYGAFGTRGFRSNHAMPARGAVVTPSVAHQKKA